MRVLIPQMVHYPRLLLVEKEEAAKQAWELVEVHDAH